MKRISFVLLCIAAVVPCTAVFARLSAAVYSDERKEIVAELQNDMLEHQIGMTEYCLPNAFLSYTGTVYYDGKNVMFFLYDGLTFDRVLVYSPESETIPADAFSSYLAPGYTCDFYDIECYAKDWWIAKKRIPKAS